jgi:hypothetical protein
VAYLGVSEADGVGVAERSGITAALFQGQRIERFSSKALITLFHFRERRGGTLECPSSFTLPVVLDSVICRFDYCLLFRPCRLPVVNGCGQLLNKKQIWPF